MSQLTVNVDHNPLGDRRGHPVLGNTEVGPTVSSRQLAQRQTVALYAVLHCNEGSQSPVQSCQIYALVETMTFYERY